MRGTLTAILVGTLLSLFAFAPSGNAQNPIDPTKKEECKDAWAFPECNEDYALCSSLGGTCTWCDTQTSQQVKNCRPDPFDSCTPDIGTAASADCGVKYRGTCVDNGQGGINCRSVPHGTCGTEVDRC